MPKSGVSMPDGSPMTSLETYILGLQSFVPGSGVYPPRLRRRHLVVRCHWVCRSGRGCHCDDSRVIAYESKWLAPSGTCSSCGCSNLDHDFTRFFTFDWKVPSDVSTVYVRTIGSYVFKSTTLPVPSSLMVSLDVLRAGLNVFVVL